MTIAMNAMSLCRWILYEVLYTSLISLGRHIIVKYKGNPLMANLNFRDISMGIVRTVFKRSMIFMFNVCIFHCKNSIAMFECYINDISDRGLNSLISLDPNVKYKGNPLIKFEGIPSYIRKSLKMLKFLPKKPYPHKYPIERGRLPPSGGGVSLSWGLLGDARTWEKRGKRREFKARK